MSAAPRSRFRLPTALTALVLGAGLLSAAHADQGDRGGDPVVVTADEGRSLPVQMASPAAPVVQQANVPAEPAVTPPAPDAVSTPAPVEMEPAPAAPAAPAHTRTASAAPATPAPPAPTPAQPAAAPAAAAPVVRHDPPPAQPPAAPPAESTDARIERAYAAAVPAAWRGAIAASFEVIPGATSWASSTGRISIAQDHLSSFDLLVDVISHEFGHLIAFRYGSQAYAGAPPAGWPAPSVRPEEAWSDCVQAVFLGRSHPSHGLPPCQGDQLRAARDWLAPGPGAHTRTA